ncbi:MAG: LacI family DNA-binding transcriptional regulator [Winogradskyella sp.]|uniref:LacI family DNA-binding transcriptional regulator n=1 Tax=Winogradskyella sp. TaxID=1883156 RepID=UPI00182D8AA5|nr:LacI family DNA-binding transcriptional regulator [Winogradskyella sp.]MBT8245056.1 LacI family transcriptional regulator [Winogradskyella sp.]NNK22102.1 LacI family DNA-binding transcriptional regulator [Winogradskyella sp.]
MVTLKELSKLLNVSVSTVSKALSDSSEISDATKRRVTELANELNYKPNRIAQQLKSSKTKVIGVVVPSLMNPFFAEVVHGIETTLEQHNYDMTVCISNESLEKEQRSFNLLSTGSVDGFIVAVARETQNKHRVKHFESVGKTTPIVMFDRVLNDVSCSKVVVDDFQTVYEATKYLIEDEKRSQILLISNIEELSVGQSRIKGYTRAIQEAGLHSSVLKLDNASNPDEIILRYLKNHTDIDAIISIDHITGIMALNMAKKLNKNVPKDISVIGFGYVDSKYVSSPRISVVDQKGFEIGKTSAKLLLDELSSDTKIKHKTLMVKSKLHLNETTGTKP